jgi:hypothetical protein
MNLPPGLASFNNQTMLDQYVTYILRSAEKHDWLEKYFDSSYLQRKKITVDLESGKEVSDLNLYFSEAELMKLRDQKQLKLEEFNKKKFGPEEKVEIHLKLKNINQLSIKTFEVNTQSYYRKYKSQFREDLDLDGLIPTQCRSVDLSHVSPLTLVRKSFEFPEIQSKLRGIFIIEFVGGGLSSRAVVRKGGLTLINQPTAKGLVFNVVNERKEICQGPRVGILVGGQYYKAEGADILIPYGSKTLSEDGVVIVDDFADIVPITVSNENYAFLTSLQFNEESLVAGNICKLIIHPKLIFNGRAISINYVKNNRVTVNATNDQGVKSSTTFSDVEFSYDKDTVVDYLVPPRLKQLEVKCEGLITLVDGTEINVSTNEYIEIQKKEGTNLFFDIYLQKTSRGYSLILLGKNGEPLAEKVMLIKFFSRFISNQPVSTELKTDARGLISLGQLQDVSSIEVNFSNSGMDVCRWELDDNKEEMHIQASYHICQGEELLLPSLGSSPSRQLHQLTQHSSYDKRLLNDAFNSFSKQGDNFVFKFAAPGLYIFTYLPQGLSVEITVLEGQRWSYSSNFIVEPQRLTKMISDLSYMSVSNKSFQDGKLKFKINCNNPSKLKAHILGFSFYPRHFGNMHNIARKMCPHYARETFGFPYTENSYLSEKLLSDEISYVLNRKIKPSHIGNTLEKPPVLLKRHFNKDTNMDEEKLQTGQDFQNKNLAQNKGAFMKADKAKLSMPPPRTFRVSRMSDFLSTEGLVLANIKANEKGEFEVAIPNWASYSTFRILVSDVMSSASFDIPLDPNNLAVADVRLGVSKQEGNIYGASRFAQTAVSSQTLQVSDIQATDSVIVDNLETVFQILRVLSQYTSKGHSIELDKWKFLVKWDTLPLQQKLKHYDEFCSHELHVFLYFRDRAFFDSHVKKFISSKSKLDTLDLIFLNRQNDARQYLDFKKFSSLTPIEIAMLVLFFRDKDPELCKAVIATIENIVGAGSTEDSLTKRYFDTVLNHQIASQPLPPTPRAAAESPKAMLMNAKKPIVTSGLVYRAPAPATRAGALPKGLARRDSRERAMPQIQRQYSNCAMSCSSQEEAASICRSRSRSPPVRRSSIRQVAEKNVRERDRARERMDSRDYNRSRSADSRASMEYSVNQAMPMQQGLLNDAIIDEIPNLQNKQVVQYKKTETTKEYIERNYYFNNDIGLSKLNSFWLNLVKGLFEKGTDFVCLDHNFILCTNTLSEMLLCLALLGLPYSKATLSTKRDGNKLTIECKEGRIIQFCKVMNETSAGRVDLDIIVSQRFYDPQDKHLFDEQNPHLATLKKVDEFLIGKIYTSRVAVTNSSDSDVEFELICEIPQGSIPVNDLDYTKTYAITCRPLETLIKEFSFYFPQEGTFSIFPATAIKSSQLITYAHLSEKQLRVVKRKTAKGMMDSISEILVSGQKKDILSFMETKNIRNSKIFNFNEIYWLFKDEKFYLQAVDILRRRFIFDQTTWAFSILHGAKREYFEYLTYTKKNFGIKYLALGDFRIDDFEIKEYSPLTNPRTHNIGNKKHNINNKEFKSTYISFLKYCLFKNDLDNRDRLVLSSYLVLQDRVDEAMAQMSGIVRNQDLAEEELKIQLDYLTAYLSLYNEYPKFPTAKGLSDKYINYHVPTWRNRFVRIANQLSEVSGANAIIETEEKVIGNEQKISKAEMLKVELRDNSIIAKSRNVDHVTVSYYEVDIEVLFSKDPFSNKDMTNTFSDVFPSHREVVKIGSGIDEVEKHIPIPEKLINKNMVIYVQTALLSEKVQFCPSALSLIVATEAGYVKVLGPDRKPLPQVYVKTFSLSGGNTAFYKDGYTDMRGVFDYSSLNLDKLDQIDRLALLVCSSTYGAVTRVVPKPSKLGQVVDNEVLVGAGQGNKTTEIY